MKQVARKFLGACLGLALLAGCGGASTVTIKKAPAAGEPAPPRLLSIADYEAALAKDRSDWRLFLGYGDALCKDHQYDRAVKAYEAILAAYPDMAEPKDKIRNAYEQAPEHFIGVKEYGKALTALKSALEAYPQDAGFVSRLGDVYAAMDRPQDAIEQYGRAIQMDPGHTGARMALDRLNAAQRDAEALVDGLTPLFDAKEYEAVIERCEKALALLPGYRPAMLYRDLASSAIALSRGKQAQYWDAVQQLSKAETYGIPSAMLQYYLGVAYEKLGEDHTDNMTTAFNRAAEVEPGSPWAAKAAERLKQVLDEREKLRKFWGK